MHGAPPTITMLNLLWSITVASYLFAGMIGAFGVPLLSERFGRRNSILILHGFVFVASFLFGFCKQANSFVMLIIARLVVGLGCGAGTGLVPMYLTEIAPINLRGALGTLHQLFLTLGILITQIFGMRQLLGTEDYWHWLLALSAVPCLISTCILPWYPDSPRFLLINKHDEAGAVRAMMVFRGTEDVNPDIQELTKEYENHMMDQDWSLGRLFTTNYLRWPIFLVCCLAVVQQLGGINVIFYYSTSVFEEAGIAKDQTQYATLGTGIINTCMTVFSVWAVEKFGRRSLLIIGMCGMCATMTTITVSLNLADKWVGMPYISLSCVILYVVFFALGLGSIPQFIGAEMFKQGPRPPAMAFAGFLNWLANFTVAISFPFIQLFLKAFSFIIFLFVVLFFLVIIWWKLPETKNRRFEDIAKDFHIDDTTEKPAIDMQALRVGDRLANSKREENEEKEKKPKQKFLHRKSRPDLPELRDPENGTSQFGAYLSVPREPGQASPTFDDP